MAAASPTAPRTVTPGSMNVGSISFTILVPLFKIGIQIYTVRNIINSIIEKFFVNMTDNVKYFMMNSPFKMSLVKCHVKYQSSD